MSPPARSITRSARRKDTRGPGMSVKPYNARQVIPRWKVFGQRLRYARDVRPDFVDAGARGDVQSLVVGVAELDVGDQLGGEDRAQMLALGRDDPHPARRRFPDVALDVDLQAVGDSGSRIAADVDEHPAVGHRVVREDAIAPHVLVAAAVRVENFFVRRQGEAVRVGDVVDDAAHFAVLDHVDALDVQGVYMIKNGKVSRIIDDIPNPNGLALSPDEKILYANGSRDKYVRRYRVLPDDTVTDSRMFIDISGDATPGITDGLKVDVRGNVWESAAGGVWIVSPEGKHLGTILTPELVANRSEEHT